MSNQPALVVWVHHANIQRYRRMLQTQLTETERLFIERRIVEEQQDLRDAAAPAEILEMVDPGDQDLRPPGPATAAR